MKNFSIRDLEQKIYTLRMKGYPDDRICIYLTKDTIKEIIDSRPFEADEIIDFTDENIRFANIPVKLNYENKVVGIAESYKL